MLRDLFPDDDESKRRIRSHRPSHVAHQLINAALWQCAHRGSLTADCVLEYIHSAIDDLRTLVKRRPIRTPVWVGFGAELPAGSRVETPWGTLRPWEERDRLLIESALRGVPPPDRGCVLETQTEVIWPVSSSVRDPGAIHGVGLEDERWKRISLALLLLQDIESPKSTEPWFCCQAQALGPGIVSSSTRQFIKGPTVSHSQLLDLQRWSHAAMHSGLAPIAVARATMMVSRITDHVDALIDGVIVWENLFGTGATQELGYRVSLNMACVLTDDGCERIALQSEIKKLYDIRSRIIHGGYHPSSSEATKLRRRVQELTLSSLQRILATHPQLLGASVDKFMSFLLTPPVRPSSL